MRDTLVDKQREDADLAGSWDPDGVWGKSAGRIYSTAVLTLTLQSHYRFARRGFDPALRSIPAASVRSLRVKIICSSSGSEVPRVPDDAETGYRLVDHKIHWAVGPERLGTIRELSDELRRVIMDPNRRVKGPDGKLQQMPVDLLVGTLACYGDVVACTDVLLDAGVRRLRLIKGCAVTLAAVEEPTKYGLDLIPPKALFCEPDDKPPAWRPVIRIDQRGRVFHEGALLHDPAKDRDDLRRVEAKLVEFRKQAEAMSLIKETEIDGRKIVRVTVPFMMAADKWTQWQYLRRVAESASRVGFFKVHLAVAETDLEAALARKAKQRKR